MNSLVGKSTGIALLMAAALLAALFAMGVFSAGSVGAQEDEDSGPTATAALVDTNDPATPATSDDIVRISISGLTKLNPHNDTELVITMDNPDLGSPITARWYGGNQGLEVFAAVSSTDGEYTFAFGNATTIEGGVAILDITQGTGASVDTNAIITAMTIGHGEADAADVLQFNFDLPDDGLGIDGAPTGPSVTLSPTSVLVNASAEDTTDDIEVTVTGANFIADGGNIGIAADPATGITFDDSDITNTELAEGTAREFTVAMTIEGSQLTSTKEITVTATQDGDGISATFTVEPLPPPVVAGVTLSSQTAGAAVQITLEANAVRIETNQDITVDFKDTGFGLPETIQDSAIDIVSTPGANVLTTGFRGSPDNVLVTGDKITMTVPSTRPNGDPQNKAVTGNYTIRIKQSAGLTNPAAAGEKTIKWQENAPDGAKKDAKAIIERAITLSKKDGTRGTETTATFKGFANGTATINLNDEKFGEVTIADNLGTFEFDTTSTKFKANQENVITAKDATGVSEDVDAKFTIKPKVVLDPEETSVSKSVTLKLSDWPTLNAIADVKIGASDADLATTQTTDGEGKAEFKVLVPADANRGSQTVKVTGTKGDLEKAPSATATLKVGVLALTIQPASVVPGQQITIEGSGFVANDEIEKVTVGSLDVVISPAAEASSAGDIVITINVPSPSDGDGIGHGTKKVSVSTSDEGSGRVAEGSIEIPEPTVTLSPAVSRRGTTVNVSGIGFPSGDLVQVKYDNNGNFVTVAAGPADASGAVSIDFDVPSYAKIGTKHDVEAVSVGVYAAVKDTVVHETPGAEVTLSTQQIASGETLTLSGMNFPAFATVAVMEIGGVDVRPVPAPATSIDGDFESTVLVPGLELGNQTVSVRVSQTTITTFLEIVATAAPSDPADVFADLIDNGSLSRAWFLERETQEWFFYDPAPEFAPFNSLNEVSTGQIVDIIMKAQDTFQGETLYVGSNPTAIE